MAANGPEKRIEASSAQSASANTLVVAHAHGYSQQRQSSFPTHRGGTHLNHTPSILAATGRAALLCAVFASSALAAAPNHECEPQWVAAFENSSSVSGMVRALTVFDDGSSAPALYAGGDFATAGGQTVNRIAKWDGSSWMPLGSGMNQWVSALAVFDDGSGPALYAGGGFDMAGDVPANHIARWDGSEWSPLGSGVDGAVFALAVFDDGSGSGPALYAAGDFMNAGGEPASRIAKWDGTSWSPLGSGVTGRVLSLAVFDDGSGSGPALYVGGAFSSAGDVTASRIARWDGSTWSSLGSGIGGIGFPVAVIALSVFDGGCPGDASLYAGGSFTTAGGLSADQIARWDGSSWSPLDNQSGGERSGEDIDVIHALAVFDDGSEAGPELYVAGEISAAGGVSVNNIVRWDGASWRPLQSGLDGPVAALTVLDEDFEGGSGALWAGGSFAESPAGESNLAKWQGCPEVEPVRGDLNGDGVVDVSDLLILLSAWGPCATLFDCTADLNGDGLVDVADLLILLTNWG